VLIFSPLRLSDIESPESVDLGKLEVEKKPIFSRLSSKRSLGSELFRSLRDRKLSRGSLWEAKEGEVPLGVRKEESRDKRKVEVVERITFLVGI
jgi:hypothetical protein